MVPTGAAASRISAAARSMPDLAASIFVPPPRLLKCTRGAVAVRAPARRLVVAHSMPDLLAAAIFVPPQRLLECAMRVPESAVQSQFMPSQFSAQRGMMSAPDLAVCLATPDPMSSREEEDEGEEEISRSLARTLAEERAGAVRRRQQQRMLLRMREGSSGACSGLRPRLASCSGVCYRCEAAPAQGARQQPQSWPNGTPRH